MGLKRRKIWIASGLIVLLAGGLAYLYRGHFHNLRSGNPNLSLDQILTERAKQADQYLDSPLGKAFYSKNWNDVRSRLKETKRPHFDLANVIRAGYIHSKIKDLVPADYSEIYLFLLDTLATPNAKDPLGYNLLLSQFERIPLPPKDSVAQTRMIQISNDPKNPLQPIVIQKWVTQAVPVPNEFLKKFTGEFPGHSDEINRNWLTTVDQIRDVNLQKSLLEKALQSYPKTSVNTQALILRTVALAQSLPSKPQQLRQYALNALESEDPGLIESAIRITPVLLSHDVFKPGDREEIQKRLTHIPAKLMTPYSALKSSEISKTLANPQPTSHP